MTYSEARLSAQMQGLDLVLRNERTDLPVLKIMNYKLELLKRLFKKLGHNVGDKKVKATHKSVKMSTTISSHDLDNKIRKSVEFLKTNNKLKFFMKVNVQDPENVQKGRLMLLNIAEDLKQYAKMTVSPGSKGL